MSVTSLVSPYPYASGNVPQETQTFPVGFGVGTTGGAGGTIIRVTNSNNSGAGSLRTALQTSGARIILFDVNSITLTSEIENIPDNVTVYGQSAGGVQIRATSGFSGNTLLTFRGDNVILQGLVFRLGGFAEADTLNIGGGSGVTADGLVIDHCSIEWGVDENLDTFGGLTNATISNCIIAQGLSNSVHSKGQHSMGAFSSISGGAFSDGVTFVNNLVAYNVDRNPWMKQGRRYEWVNNYVYGVGCANSRYGQFGSNVTESNIACNAAILNNFYKKSSESQSTTRGFNLDNQEFAGDWYISGNIVRRADNSNEPTLWTGDTGTTVSTTTSPFTMSGIEELLIDAADVPEFVLANVGCRHTDRDTIDAAIVALVEAQSPGIIDDQSEMGGFPTYTAFTPYTDTDNDGIPDVFEGSFSDLDEFMQYLIYNPLPREGSTAGETITASAGTLTFTGHTANVVSSAAAIPVIDTASATSVHLNSNQTSVTITKPSGAAVGEVLVFIGMGLFQNPTDGWAAETGWTQNLDTFNTSTDVELGMYWRAVDGTEGSSFTFDITPTGNSRLIGHMFRLQGANATAPINVQDSTPKQFTGLSSHTVDEVTTTVDNCLALSIFAFHGTDGAPVSTSGTGWSEEWELYGGGVTGNGGYPMLVICQKDVASAGVTGDVTHGTAVADRGTSLQLAFAPA